MDGAHVDLHWNIQVWNRWRRLQQALRPVYLTAKTFSVQKGAGKRHSQGSSIESLAPVTGHLHVQTTKKDSPDSAKLGEDVNSTPLRTALPSFLLWGKELSRRTFPILLYSSPTNNISNS